MSRVTAKRTQAVTAHVATELPPEQLSLILAKVPARVWYKDDQNRILWLNEAAASSMGLPREECLGADTYDLFPAMAEKYHRDDLAVLALGVPRLGIEERYGPRTGTTGWVRTDKIPTRDPSTGEPRLVVVSTDVTDTKRTEETLRQANASLSDFASMASHDLRGPLRQICMLTELIEEEMDAEAGAAVAHLGEVKAAAQRLLGLVGSLLEISRVSQRLPNLLPVRLANVARAAARLRADELPSAQVTVSGTAMACGDAVLLEHLFSNLIDNARKYRGEGTGSVRIDVFEDGDDAVARVVDDGPGIPEEHRSRAFEMFRRLPNDVGTSGHGVGLALCRRIAIAHGGSIEAVSPAPGEGAVIELRLCRAARGER